MGIQYQPTEKHLYILYYIYRYYIQSSRVKDVKTHVCMICSKSIAYLPFTFLSSKVIEHSISSQIGRRPHAY